MKKHIVWCLSFMVTLMLACSALSVTVPPQTAGEVATPAHTVPEITNIQISGDTVTVDTSESCDWGYITLNVESSSGTYSLYVPATYSDGSLAGSIGSSFSDDATYTLIAVEMHKYSPSSNINLYYSYDGDGALVYYLLFDYTTDTDYSFDSQKRVTSFYTGDMSASYNGDGNLQMYSFFSPGNEQRFNGLHELTYEKSTDSGTGSVTEKYYDGSTVTKRRVTNTDNSWYEYDAQGILRQSSIPGTDGSVTRFDYDESGNLLYRTVTNADNSKYVYDGQGLLRESSIPGADGSVTACFYDESGALTHRIVTYADNSRYSYDGDGNLLQSLVVDGDGTRIISYYDESGALYRKIVRYMDNNEYEYDGQGTLRNSTIFGSDGSVTYSSFDESGVLAYRTVYKADHSRYEYDGQGTLRESYVEDNDSAITNRYDVNGNLYSYILYTDATAEVYLAGGTLFSRRTYDGLTVTYEEFKKGKPVYKKVSGYLPDNSYYYDEFKKGVFTKRTIWDGYNEYHYDADGNYIGKTINGANGEETYNAKDELTGYTVFSPQQGGVYLTYNHRRALQALEYYDPYSYDQYRYDAKAKIWYLNGVPYSGPVPVVLKTLQLEMEIVWYPNNTVCSFGPQFREVDPGLTDLWYMFTPVDLSRDGTQTFELVGGSVYVLGTVSVTVSGDSVTVTYSTVKGENGHIYTKSEYLNIFKDFKSVTTVVPEELGEGFRFGQEISIQKDLGGDTNVLMFVRNVATFRNFVTEKILLRRYYNNYPGRVKLRDAMLKMMD